MANYRYKVSIKKQPAQGLFRINWRDIEKGTENFFEVPAPKLAGEEKRLKSWKKPGNRLATGRELFDFLEPFG